MKKLTHLLIDGYNVIHACQPFQSVLKKNLDAACKLLIEHIVPLHSNEKLRTTIVFDGKGLDIQIEHPTNDPSFSVLFTPSGTTADTLIEQLVFNSQHKNPFIVVSADNALIQTVSSMGAHALTPSDFKDWLERSNKAQSSKILDHQKKSAEQWKQANPWKNLK